MLKRLYITRCYRISLCRNLVICLVYLVCLWRYCSVEPWGKFCVIQEHIIWKKHETFHSLIFSL